jgi:Rrf2 family protein|nr:Rrf2 family transcriptional regulator [Candidatus Krumholzibacteria bacterium]
MMVSQTAEYALRAVVVLGKNPDNLMGTKQISIESKVPAGYLSKVLQTLARANLVTSTPGRSGGFQLSHAPEEISVFDVIQAIEPLQRIHSCPLSLPGHGTNLCPLHRRLDDAMAQTEAAFRNSTVAEIMAERTDSPPLCEMPS